VKTRFVGRKWGSAYYDFYVKYELDRWGWLATRGCVRGLSREQINSLEFYRDTKDGKKVRVKQ